MMHFWRRQPKIDVKSKRYKNIHFWFEDCVAMWKIKASFSENRIGRIFIGSIIWIYIQIMMLWWWEINFSRFCVFYLCRCFYLWLCLCFVLIFVFVFLLCSIWRAWSFDRWELNCEVFVVLYFDDIFKSWCFDGGR